MESVWLDIRYGLRNLRSRPVFAVATIITLALGIGANTAIFSIVNAYLFKPLPVKDPEQLVAIGVIDNHIEVPHETSFPTYEDVQAETEVFSGAVAFTNSIVNLNIDGRPERTWVELVTGNYFSMLGVEPALGRAFAPDEARAPGASPVMVLSYNFWKKRFGGSTDVIGKTLNLNGRPFSVIGVAPENFPGTESLLSIDAYVPIMMKSVLYSSSKTLTSRDEEGVRMIGRLKPGIDVDQASAALDLLSRRLKEQHPEIYKEIKLIAVPETKARPAIAVSNFMPIIAASFMGLAALILLIACANVANLILAGAAARRKELAVRSAVGATRFRLIRLLLTESLILGAVSGAFGFLLALWTVDLLSAIRLSTDAPVRFDISPDWRVFAFSLTAALLTGIVSGLAPALQSSQLNLNETLKEGSRAIAPSFGKMRKLLVISQVAASLLLLICAGLFVRSLHKAQTIELGFRVDNLLMFSADLELQGYDKESGKRFCRQLIDRLEALPGVRSASLASGVPLGYNNEAIDVYMDGPAQTAPEDYTAIFFNKVGRGYFSTLGIPILAGREFNERDDESSMRVAVINETMARKFWPSENAAQSALGKRFKLSRDGSSIEIVGVVKDGKYLFIGEDPRPFLYLSFEQRNALDATFFISAEGDPNGLATAARQAVSELNKDMPIYDVKSMEAHLNQGIAFLFVRVGAWLAGAFGAIGLVLAVVGIYGVVSYSVGLRRHEIAVRMALGARKGDILALILKQGMTLTAIGAAIGLAAAFALTRLLASLLYGIDPIDPMTFSIVSAITITVSAAAAYIPARRAAKIDPMVALRYE